MLFPQPSESPMASNPNADETIDARACAELLHCSTEKVEDLAGSGELPAVKFGRGWIFVRADLLAYLAQRAREEAARRQEKRIPAPEASVLKAVPLTAGRRRRVPPVLPPLPHLPRQV